MNITCISDLHGYLPELPGGDLLIVAGDITAKDTLMQLAEFFKWLKAQTYTKKILVGGNHDNFLASAFPKNQKEAEDLSEVKEWLEKFGEDTDLHDFEYLCDSGTEFEYEEPIRNLFDASDRSLVLRKKLKIWGCPHSLIFQRLNPKCTAFTGTEEELAVKYTMIPNDTDILISHTPFLHMLDQNIDGYHCGSWALRDAVNRVKPRLFVCGHIHEQGGNQLMYKHGDKNTWCVNASYVNANYLPVNAPIRIEL